MTQHWLKALIAIGYTFPPVIEQRAAVSLPPVIAAKEGVVSAELNVRSAGLQQQAQQQNHRWAVFISDAPEPTPAMRSIAAFSGWNVLVVATTNSGAAEAHSDAWSSLPNLTHLTTDQQNLLGFGVSKHLPESCARYERAQHGEVLLFEYISVMVLARCPQCCHHASGKLTPRCCEQHPRQRQVPLA